jgi:23S rRNA maturation mini-RNase III
MIKKLKKISKQLKKSVSAHKKQATFLEKHAKSMKNKKVMKASRRRNGFKGFCRKRCI